MGEQELRLRDLCEGEVLARIFPILAAAPPPVRSDASSAGADTTPLSDSEGEPRAQDGHERVLIGPGDDAALVASASGAVIATTDSMVRGKDWRDDWSSAHDVGIKLVAQNVADIAAMGGVPTALLVSLMADPRLEMTWVEDFARGLASAATDARCPVVGGDLSSAPEGVVVLSMTALGDLEGRAPVLRSGACVGEVVAVSGGLGWSGAGLATYAAGLAEAQRTPHSSTRDEAVSLVRWYHRSPRPPWESGPVAAAAGATAMLDISDGLVRDGGRIAQASDVGLALESRLLREHFLGPPLTDAVDEEEAWRQILSGGEEHSLLATFPVGCVPDDERAPWRVIGRCVAPGPAGPTVTVDGIRPFVSGWDHFHPRS